MKKTPLNSFHRDHGARLVDFAGWEMPLLYRGIVEEHQHTRKSGSVFDVSHMGRIVFEGDDAEALLEHVCTRRLGNAQVGQSRYSHVCNEAGGILDDVIVSRYDQHWMMVCNAANRERILDWVAAHATGKSVDIRDTTEETLMVAVQGPRVMEILAQKLPIPIADLKRYRFTAGSFFGTPYSIFRSGYTGEDGVEMILPASVAPLLLGLLDGLSLDDQQILPGGLGARDTLRMEAGMPLYGHELTEATDSIAAGCGWCVDLQKDFIGVEKLRDVDREGPSRQLVGLEVAGKRIARAQATILHENQPVGVVTSGTRSPTLGTMIAMAYVRTDLARPAQTLEVDLGGKTTEASVTALPFYRRPSG